MGFQNCQHLCYFRNINLSVWLPFEILDVLLPYRGLQIQSKQLFLNYVNKSQTSCLKTVSHFNFVRIFSYQAQDVSCLVENSIESGGKLSNREEPSQKVHGMGFKASTQIMIFSVRKYGLHQKKKWFALCGHSIMDFMQMLIILHLDKVLERILCQKILKQKVSQTNGKPYRT